MAIAEGGGCGGNYQYRWDINGDGDFDDGNEGWRGTNPAGTGAVGMPLDSRSHFQRNLVIVLSIPKWKWIVPESARRPSYPSVRVDRMCPNYPNDFHGGCRAEKDENIKLTSVLLRPHRRPNDVVDVQSH